MTNHIRDFVLTVEYTDSLCGEKCAVWVQADLLETAIASADWNFEFDLADALRAALQALVAAEERVFRKAFSRLRFVR